MKESTCRRALIVALRKAGLDPEPVENACKSGTPDLNYVHGWIEMKMHEATRPEQVVKLTRFTPLQRNWLRRREAAGGRAWLLLRHRTGGEWLLVRGCDVDRIEHPEHGTLAEVQKLAYRFPSAGLLAEFLRTP